MHTHNAHTQCTQTVKHCTQTHTTHTHNARTHTTHTAIVEAVPHIHYVQAENKTEECNKLSKELDETTEKISLMVSLYCTL